MLRGAYTPQVQEAVARLGSRLPYSEAQEELAMMWGINSSVASVREITMRNGRLANDGAVWIQAFIDYHCPTATRVIDFAHDQEYLATIGKALYGAESDRFQQWYSKMSKQLGRKAPQRTLNELRFLWTQNQAHPAANEIETAIRYLERHQTMIDYPHFRKNGIPIGSGIVESGHKVVMQRRMKQAGMRWAEENLNPMLALRMAICNKRWAASWQAIQAHYLTTKHASRLPLKAATPPSQLVTEADAAKLEKLAEKIHWRTQKRRPWKDHRWIFPLRVRPLHKI